MSWHYSQALVEEFWGENCLDGEQSVQLNKTPTASLHLPKDKMKAFSRLSQSGMTFAPLTEHDGEELLTLYLGDFHAQIFPLPEKGLESREKKVASGQKWQGLLAKYDPDLHLLKTVQCSLFEDSTQYSVTLPKWGLMQNGDVFQQPKSEQITKGIESGLLQETKWPTPTASTGGASKNPENPRGKHGGNPLATAVQMWPTPDANMGARGTQENWTKIRPSGQPAQYTLNQAVRDSLDVAVQHTNNQQKTGGQLNPTWVEWLMGWPLGWTDLKPLEMDKFQKWLELHGRY